MASRTFRLRSWRVLLALLAVTACSSQLEPAGPGPEPPLSDVIPAQSFRIDVDLVDGTRVSSGEADHWLYTRPLEEVLDGPKFQPDNLRANRALELLDHDGTVLESYPVYVQHVAVDPGPDFEEWEAVFQDPPDFASFRFVRGSQTVHEQPVSPNAPEVSFSGLEQGQVFASDALLWFRLQVEDKDQDDLDVVILVSVDGGKFEYHRLSFSHNDLRGLTVEDYSSPLRVTSGNSAQEIPRIVPAGSEAVRLLAVVSDGSRVTAAQSPAFALEPLETLVPTVDILIMPDGQAIGPNGPFGIKAFVVEERYQHGDLRRRHIHFPQPVEDPALRWTSDIDGDITEHIRPWRESGGFIEIDQSLRRFQSVGGDDPIIDYGRLRADALTPGIHKLTATFTTESGLQASDSITVTILDPDDP